MKHIIIALILINSFFTTIVYSQQTGILSGTVIDSETGENLRSASVLLIGIKKGAYSDVKGSFKITNIPTGKYNLKVSYIGYAAQEIENIEITDKSVTKIDVALIPESRRNEGVTVEARRSIDNQAAILSARKNSSQVSDGISSEEIKKYPDSDAGQSLRRISGITLVNDKFIFVRGVSDRYSNTTINGTSLSSTEPDKKAFSFDIFPAEFLQNANISKSFTPDLPGNFAGGLVQLNTIDFPNGFQFKVNIGSSMSDNVTMHNATFMRDRGGASDWLGFDDGSRGLPGSLPGSPYEMKQILNDLKSIEDEAKWKEANKKWQSINQEFKSSLWKRDTLTASPNQNYSITYTDLLTIAGNDFGIISSFMSNNSYTYNTIERGRFDYSITDYDYFGSGSQSIYSTNLGGMLNLAYKIGDNTSLSWQNIYNNSSDNETTIIEGFKDTKNNKTRQYGYQFVQKVLLSTQLGGEHNLPFNNSLLEWKAGVSKSQRNEPDFRRARYFKNGDIENDQYKLDIYSNSGVGYLAGRFFSYLNETATSGKLDLTVPINENTKFKAGGLYEGKNRSFEVRSLTITMSKALMPEYFDPDFGYFIPNYGDDEFFDQSLYAEPDIIFDQSNFNANRLGFSEETKETDSYKANESLIAAYAMTDFSLFIGSNKLRLIGGIRIENSNQRLFSFYPIGFNNNDSTFVNKNFLDWLPAISMIYQISAEMNLRLSATRTLTRPSLREYAPFTFYDFQFQGEVTGNANLERALIQNYDLRWEMFPNPGEVISVGGFYKVFQNAIEETIIPTSSNFKRTYDNAKGNAYNYGLEFEFRKQLNFIDNFFKYFLFNMNLAVIKSEISVIQSNSFDKRSMWGQSPYSFNCGLFYNNPEWGTSVNLGYNVFGKRIIQVVDIQRTASSDPHVYELPRNVIDLSISQVIDRFEIKFVAKDMLNEKLIWEQVGKTVASNYRGRGYSITFSYKI